MGEYHYYYTSLTWIHRSQQYVRLSMLVPLVGFGKAPDINYPAIDNLVESSLESENEYLKLDDVYAVESKWTNMFFAY